MIRLGLERIAQLWKPATNYITAIHIAGTNGKGSVANYIAAGLLAHGLRVGKFTSPHLIHRWDSITVDGVPIYPATFDRHYNALEEKNRTENIGASPFELLTATAFEVFHTHKCEVWVVECGMGGKYDATNILENKLATVITKVGLDHQDFLGNSLAEIARDKCGIFRPKVPIFFDPTNNAEVLRTIRRASYQTGAFLRPRWDAGFDYDSNPVDPEFTADKVVLALEKSTLGSVPYQVTNANLAFGVAYRCLQMKLQSELRNKMKPLNPQLLLDSIISTKIPGRFEEVTVRGADGSARKVVLDGAHNPQAMNATSPVFARLRDSPDGSRSPITWIIAFSEGKPLGDMLAPVVQPGDSIAVVEFGPVEGMPWKRSMPESEITSFLKCMKDSGFDIHYRAFGSDVSSALGWALSHSAAPIVGVGSLYLVSDLTTVLANSYGA